MKPALSFAGFGNAAPSSPLAREPATPDSEDEEEEENEQDDEAEGEESREEEDNEWAGDEGEFYGSEEEGLDTISEGNEEETSE